MSLERELDAAAAQALEDHRVNVDPLVDPIAYRTAFFAGATWAAERLNETQRAEIAAVTRVKGV